MIFRPNARYMSSLTRLSSPIVEEYCCSPIVRALKMTPALHSRQWGLLDTRKPYIPIVP